MSKKREQARMPKVVLRLEPGEKHLFGGRLDDPELTIVGEGRLAYLWVGGRGCVGTLKGRALRRLAQAILERTDP